MRNIKLTEWDLRSHMDRFLERVVVRDVGSCWRWTGAVNSGGSGTFAIVRAGERHSRSVYAHRVAMFYFTGRIVTPDEDVRHLCSCGVCCNPDHLEVVPNPRATDGDEE